MAQARGGDAPAGAITCEASSDDRLDIRVIGSISWWAGNDVVPIAERLMDERPKAVSLYIDSPGGDLFDALHLRAALDACGAEITVQAGAVVASAAVPLYLTGTVRSVQSYTRFMVHQPRVTFVASGTAQDITEALAAFAPTLEAALGLYSDTLTSHVDAQTVAGWLAENRDVWLTAEEAREHGIVTEAPPSDDDEEPATARMRDLVQGLASLYRKP